MLKKAVRLQDIRLLTTTLSLLKNLTANPGQDLRVLKTARVALTKVKSLAKLLLVALIKAKNRVKLLLVATKRAQNQQKLKNLTATVTICQKTMANRLVAIKNQLLLKAKSVNK